MKFAINNLQYYNKLLRKVRSADMTDKQIMHQMTLLERNVYHSLRSKKRHTPTDLSRKFGYTRATIMAKITTFYFIGLISFEELGLCVARPHVMKARKDIFELALREEDRVAYRRVQEDTKGVFGLLERLNKTIGRA